MIDDDARDVRAALGGLLVDEPQTGWSVRDDVARGRALQRRRRTTALGGVGLAAAAALIVGAVGPWSPTAIAPPGSGGGDVPAVVVAQLEEYGMEVDSSVSAGIPAGGSVWSFRVTGPEPRSTEGSTATLEIRVLPGVGAGARGEVPGSALAICVDAGGCGSVTRTISDCSVAGACPESYSAVVDPAVDRFERRTLISGLVWDGGAVVEALVPPFAFDTEPFLTDQQTYDLLRAVSAAAALGPPLPTPRPGPATIEACARGEVKLIPAAGNPSDDGGSVGIWIEIHARNPEVGCLATRPVSVALHDAGGGDLAMLNAEGVYQGRDLEASGVEVTQASGPARFALTQARCDSPAAIPAATAYVTLQGWDRPVAVELPDSAGLGRCPDGSDAEGRTVYLSLLEGGLG